MHSHLGFVGSLIKVAGNYANEYGANIGEPLGEPTVQWNYGL